MKKKILSLALALVMITVVLPVAVAADDNTEMKSKILEIFATVELQYDEEITSLAKSITESISSDYEKAKAIYAWVADNVWYDYDCRDAPSGHNPHRLDACCYTTTFEVLEHKRTVCEGYTNLTTSLLHSIGIPTVQPAGHGHTWNEAYVDGRWIIMDTSHSSNSYRDGVFSEKKINSYTSFDMSSHVALQGYYPITQIIGSDPSLIGVVIPESITKIENYVFGSGGGSYHTRTIYGKTGSYAELYASTHVLRFIDPDNDTSRIKITIDGKEIYIDIPPVMIDGQVFTRDARLLEGLGMRVATYDDKGRLVIWEHGKQVTIDIIPKIIGVNMPSLIEGLDNNFYCSAFSVRSVAEYFSLKADWDGTTNTMMLTTPNPLDSASGWAREGITAAIAKDFVPADLQDTYTATITRAEFCRMAVKWVEAATGKTIDAILAENGKTRNPNAFTDVTNSDILAAAALGITGGTGPGTFSPNGQITREQAATMIRNTCKAIGMDTDAPPPSGFADIETASDWAVDAINFCRANGIMSGTGQDNFSPNVAYTREQSIVTFNNIKE